MMLHGRSGWRQRRHPSLPPSLCARVNRGAFIMPKPIDHVTAALARWRKAGKTSDHFARDLFSVSTQAGVDARDLSLFLPERRAYERFLQERDQKRKKNQTAQHNEQPDRVMTPATAARREGMRKGGAVMVSKVCAALGCTRTELNRWAADGRLPPDGEIVTYFGRAVAARVWLPATIDAARINVGAWRAQDSIRKAARRRGLRAIG